VGGTFTHSNGTVATNIAYYQPGKWSRIGGGLGDRVRALAVYDADAAGPNPGNLFAGGDFNYANVSSGVLVGSSITVANTQTGASVTQQANASGVYVFANVQPGTYTVKVEMDGFSSNNGVIVLAATNRADVLDSRSLRRHRLGRRIQSRQGVAELEQVDVGPIPFDEEGLDRVAAERCVHDRRR
jgi:hypothetical protein